MSRGGHGTGQANDGLLQGLVQGNRGEGGVDLVGGHGVAGRDSGHQADDQGVVGHLPVRGGGDDTGSGHRVAGRYELGQGATLSPESRADRVIGD